MTDTLVAPVQVSEAAKTADTISATLPGFVFQGSTIITFQAFRNGSDVLVQMTQIGTSYSGTTSVTLSPSKPTTSLDIKVWVGSGSVQINDGTVKFTLNADGSTPSTVTVNLLLNVYSSSTGKFVATVGGVYQLTC